MILRVLVVLVMAVIFLILGLGPWCCGGLVLSSAVVCRGILDDVLSKMVLRNKSRKSKKTK